MVFQPVGRSFAPKLRVMKTVRPSWTIRLHALHYLIDESGDLKAYEYTALAGRDMSSHSVFLEEFVKLVAHGGLQHKWDSRPDLNSSVRLTLISSSQRIKNLSMKSRHPSDTISF